MNDATSLARRWLAELATDPTIHVHSFDILERNAVLVQLDEAAVHAAAFLDDRALAPGAQGVVVPLEVMLEAAARIPARPHDAIFHVARCGSTLVSRLLGELPGSCQKREPLPWLACGRMARVAGGTVAPRAFLSLFEATSRALARPFHDGDRVTVKSSSIAASLAQPLLNREASQKALMLTLPLERWLATVIADDASRGGIEANSEVWAGDLHFRRPDLDLPNKQFVMGEILAASWCAPMMWFGAARRFAPDRTKLCDVDQLLAEPGAGLAELAGFLGLPATRAQVQDVVEGDVLRSYSKDPAEPFDREARDARIAAAMAEHRREIDAGLRFAERFVQDEPLIGEHLR